MLDEVNLHFVVFGMQLGEFAHGLVHAASRWSKAKRLLAIALRLYLETFFAISMVRTALFVSPRLFDRGPGNCMECKQD